jgi:hypothetical protein
MTLLTLMTPKARFPDLAYFARAPVQLPRYALK